MVLRRFVSDALESGLLSEKPYNAVPKEEWKRLAQFYDEEECTPPKWTRGKVTDDPKVVLETIVECALDPMNESSVVLPDRNAIRSIYLMMVGNVAIDAREKFETGKVEEALLRKLYFTHTKAPDMDEFIRISKETFPNGNCGLAALYLHDQLRKGTIVNGRYSGNDHTFLLLDDETIVDITADQFGGPKIYAGPLKEPWSLKH